LRSFKNSVNTSSPCLRARLTKNPPRNPLSRRKSKLPMTDDEKRVFGELQTKVKQLGDELSAQQTEHEQHVLRLTLLLNKLASATDNDQLFLEIKQL